jgi:type IV pilus assembly protein PilE
MMKAGVLKRKLKAFTLIEVMIVVAIVGLLASIALPAYNDQIRKSRRTDVQREMMIWAQALERAASADPVTGYGTCATGKPTGTASNSHYTFSIDSGDGGACTSTSFTLAVVPVSGGSQVADGSMTLSSTGARTPAAKWKN